MKKLIIYGLIAIMLVASVLANDIAIDDFETGGFSGGTGWNNAWSYTGTCEILTSSNPIDTYNMRGTQGCSAIRNLDTTGYDQVNVTFYATAGSLESGEFCRYYYNDGTTDHLLLELGNGDDDNSHDYYNIDVTSYGLSTSAGMKMATSFVTTGDYCYLDNVQIVGEGSVTLDIFVDDKYLINQQDVEIRASSSATNQLHTIELRDASNTVFCTDDVMSPAVPYTSFSTFCDMPATTQTDATATVFLTSDSSVTFSKNFNVTQSEQNPAQLDIKQVYYSPQVLQGGTTEIFAVVNSVQPIDDLFITVTFPDNRKRVFYMSATQNTNEYKATITDTYQVGIVYFNIRADSGIYFDTYNNNYEVAAYNVNFVELVNQVGEVLNVKTVENLMEDTIEVHGTEYKATDRGKIFIQVLDGNNLPIPNATCYASIYYPDDSPFKYQQLMSYVDEGLYNYNFEVPYPAGVYMVSSYCFMPEINISGSYVDDNFESGTTSGGSGWDGAWTLGGAALSTAQAYDGSYSLLIADDDNPNRLFTGSVVQETVDISFWWRASSIEGGEYVYFYLNDASGTPHLLETITDGDDDGVWHHSTTTLSSLIDLFDFDGTLNFRGTTSGNLEPWDYVWFDTINISLNIPVENISEEYQVVRGSGEVHVSTENGNYVANLNIGELRNDSFTESFTFHYNVISQTAVDLEEQPVELPLWTPFPCDHIINVSLNNGTDLELLTYGVSIDEIGKCVVKVYLDLDSEATYDVEILTESYWKVMFLEDYSTLLLEEEMINISCQNYVTVNGLAPIPTPMNYVPYGQDNLWLSCASYLDASYHYKESSGSLFYFLAINYNFSFEEMEGLQSTWIHLENIKYRTAEYANTIFNGLNLGGTYSLGLIADPTDPPNPAYSKYFAAISTGYLNYASMQTIPIKVWNHSVRNLTYYAPASVDYETASDYVWNRSTRNLTYIPPANVDFDTVADYVWNDTNRTLTNVSNVATDIWNYEGTASILTQLIIDIWNYVGRYTHGIVS